MSRNKRLVCPLFISLFLATAACTSTTIVEPFYRPESARVDQAYVSPTAEFRNYTKLMARPLEIYYPDDVSPPSAQDVDQLRRLFRDAFLHAVGQDYDIVGEPGPDVMLVTAQIVDLKILGNEGTYIPSGRLREVTARGQLTLLLEFQDSLTGRVLARAGEADRGTATAESDESASWSEVRDAAARWAGLFRDFLDENLGPS